MIKRRQALCSREPLATSVFLSLILVFFLALPSNAVWAEPASELGVHVYLVPKAQVRSEADVKSATPVDLGRLRSFEGSQRYPIPDATKLDDYKSVVIWCEQFSVLISPADLMLSGPKPVGN